MTEAELETLKDLLTNFVDCNCPLYCDDCILDATQGCAVKLVLEAIEAIQRGEIL